MGLRVVVVGVAGVGKTTVVSYLIRKFKGALLVNFGSVMFEEAKSRKWAKHRDELRKLTVARQKELQTLAAGKISRQKEKVVLVDTHVFVRTAEGYWPGLPFEVVRALKPTHLVLVEASPDEIVTRRAKDRKRYRDSVDKARVAEEIELARGFLTVSSTLTGAPMLMVINGEGKASEAAGRIATALGKALS